MNVSKRIGEETKKLLDLAMNEIGVNNPKYTSKERYNNPLTAEYAMKKLTAAAIEYMDIAPEHLYPAKIREIAKGVVESAITGNVADVHNMGLLHYNEREELGEFLKSVVVGNPTSKLVKAIYNFGQVKPVKPSTISNPTSSDNKIKLQNVADIIGLQLDKLTSGELKKLTKIMQKAENAETSVQINYIRSLMKKLWIPRK